MRITWRAAVSVGLSLGLAVVVLSVGGCREYEFLAAPPTLRGITIPLPPPSFADDLLISLDLEGTVPVSFVGPGTEAFVFEKGTQRGYFVFTDTNEYTVYDLLVDLDDNCIETWVVSEDDEESTRIDYKAVLLEGEACADPSCSAPDQLGACVCLEKWSAGC
jgi:hypothetical protein